MSLRSWAKPPTETSSTMSAFDIEGRATAAAKTQANKPSLKRACAHAVSTMPSHTSDQTGQATGALSTWRSGAGVQAKFLLNFAKQQRAAKPSCKSRLVALFGGDLHRVAKLG